MKFSALGVCLALFTLTADAGEPDPLFQSDEYLEITLRGPFNSIMQERSVEEEEAGTLLITQSDGEQREFNIKLRARGNFRRKKNVCDFTPLRVNFRKSEVKGTIFANQDKLKLVTHCRTRGEGYKHGVQNEYLAYRILNQMTDASFRVRLLKVRYEDTTGRMNDEQYAFFIEDLDRLANRLDREVFQTDRIEVSQLDPEHLQLTSLFQLLIGNTDFSPIASLDDSSCCHNHRLLAADEGPMYSVPYDFDLSGLVDVEHAVPNARFRIRTVTQRLYRGRCANNALLPQTVARYQQEREAILSLIEQQEGLSKRARKTSARYVRGFYRLIDDPELIQKRLVDDCI